MLSEILLALFLCITIAVIAYIGIYVKERRSQWPSYQVVLYIPYPQDSVSSMVQRYHSLKDDFASYWKECLSEQSPPHIEKSRYLRPATTQQLKYLHTIGFFNPGPLSEGQASDLLGLNDEPEVEDLKVLEFFKYNTQHLSAKIAAWKATKLLLDAENKKAFYFQPVSSLQKEEFKFFRWTLPKGCSMQEAEQILQCHRIETQMGEPLYWKQWCGYKYILDAFITNEQGDLYELLTPSVAQIRHAVDCLAQKGYTVEALMDLEYTAHQLIELYPKLIKP